MPKRLVYFSISVLIVQALWVIHRPVAANTLSTSAKRVEGCHFEEFGAHNVLRDMAQKAHVVIGLETIQPGREATFVLDFPGGTVADLLNMFVSQAPNYRWEETEGGVIRVFRQNAHVSLTEVTISYPGATKKTRQEIWEDIAHRPEISAWMNSNRCSRGELFNGKEFSGNNGPISIAPESMTVAQLLDEVAVKSGVNYWAVLQSPPSSPCQVDIILW